MIYLRVVVTAYAVPVLEFTLQLCQSTPRHFKLLTDLCDSFYKTSSSSLFTASQFQQQCTLYVPLTQPDE